MSVLQTAPHNGFGNARMAHSGFQRGWAYSPIANNSVRSSHRLLAFLAFHPIPSSKVGHQFVRQFPLLIRGHIVNNNPLFNVCRDYSSSIQKTDRPASLVFFYTCYNQNSVVDPRVLGRICRTREICLPYSISIVAIRPTFGASIFSCYHSLNYFTVFYKIMIKNKTVYEYQNESDQICYNI